MIEEGATGRYARGAGGGAGVGERKRTRWHYPVVGIAAAAALFVLWAALRDRPEEFFTGMAERESALLNDGSRVELNAQTRLTVNFTRKERRVRFERGEALFDVAPDERRPFAVETTAGVVRATGTIFNVRAPGSGRMEVTVLEGAVRVQTTNSAGNEAMLTADMQARLDADGSLAAGTLPDGGAEDVVAWRQGQVVFHDTPLGLALERFAAYHAKRIVVEPSAAEQRLGGRFALDDLNGMLNSVERVLPVRVSRDPDGGLRIKGLEP